MCDYGRIIILWCEIRLHAVPKIILIPEQKSRYKLYAYKISI